MNGEPLIVFHATLDEVMSPVPSGRIARVGPARPEQRKSMPSPATGVGVTSTRLPLQVHTSLPFSGSYAYTVNSLLTMIRSFAPTVTAIGEPQPTFSLRGVRHNCSPVFLSNAA